MQFWILYSDIFFLAKIPHFNYQINFQSSHLTKKETEDASKRLSSYCMGALNYRLFFKGAREENFTVSVSVRNPSTHVPHISDNKFHATHSVRLQVSQQLNLSGMKGHFAEYLFLSGLTEYKPWERRGKNVNVIKESQWYVSLWDIYFPSMKKLNDIFYLNEHGVYKISCHWINQNSIWTN